MGLICKSTAKQVYGLSDGDLQKLKCKLAENPHYANAAPMRLFDEDQCLRLGEKKRRYNERKAEEEEREKERVRKQKEAEKEKARELARQERDREKEQRKQQAREVNEKLKSIKKLDLNSGSLKLPQEILFQVLTGLVDSYEPQGLRGLSAILEDILNAGQSCPDFYIVQARALAYFASRLSDIDSPLDWDEILSQPNKVVLQTLKQAAKELELTVSGTKPGESLVRSVLKVYLTLDLISRILGYFKMQRPTPVPAKIVFAVTLERRVPLV